jgi:IS30 family transposase
MALLTQTCHNDPRKRASSNRHVGFTCRMLSQAAVKATAVSVFTHAHALINQVLNKRPRRMLVYTSRALQPVRQN